MFEPSYIKNFLKKYKELVDICKEISLAPTKSKFQKNLPSNYTAGCKAVKELQAIANSPIALKYKEKLLERCDSCNRHLQEIYTAAAQNNAEEAERIQSGFETGFKLIKVMMSHYR